jgi:putative PIN family toxin of toxin-antitoxin system
VIRATVDTSALAPAIRRVGQSRSALGPILRAWYAQRYVLVLSEPILVELQHTLAAPYFSRFLSERDQEEAILALRIDATIVPITATVEGVATHPEDDLILATAVSGQVNYLVTLDQQLLRLGSYSGVQIVSPQAFLAILAQGS